MQPLYSRHITGHAHTVIPSAAMILALALLAGCSGQNDNQITTSSTATNTDTAVITQTEETSATDTAAKTETVESGINSDTLFEEESAGTLSVPSKTKVTPIPLRRLDDWVDWDADYNTPKVSAKRLKEGLVSHDVYVGKDDWMFYVDSIGDYLANNSYSKAKLKRIANQAQQRADWCEERGIQFYFMIAPNKNTIYPEKMMSSMQEGENKRIDQVYDYLAENTTVKCIDVRDSLFAAKKAHPEEDLYYKLDTHWNSRGGFYAYQAIMDVIEKDFPDLTRMTADDYQVDIFDSHFKDCAYYLGFYDTLESTGPVYTKLDGKTGVITDHDWSGEFGQFAHGYVDPETGFTESCFYAESENVYAKDQPSVYFIRDSFYMPMANFFRDTFSHVTSHWTTAFPNDDIEGHMPDIVIYECVEAKMDDTFGNRTFAN